MKSPLHLLHLEDDPDNAALERGGLGMILSDFSMPAFDGLSALDIAHARFPEAPFIQGACVQSNVR